MTQCEEIIEYLHKFGSITPLEALDELGCFRLASRISDLNKRGYHINKKMISHTNYKGQKKRYAMYYLEGTECRDMNLSRDA